VNRRIDQSQEIKVPYSDYRTALVTGASTGIGAAVVDKFRARGLVVHAVARDKSRLTSLSDRTGAIPHAVDLADTAALNELVADLPIDVLVNNAGVSSQGNILTSSQQDVDDQVDVNLRALLHLVRLTLPGMVDRDLGHVVNISSIAGHYNFYGHTVYHATKAAVHQISRQLRNDTVGKRIRVTEICPGRVETEIFGRNLGGTPAALKEAWETYYEGYESLKTEDIVNAIDFAIAAPRHVNMGLMEIMPTFQVPGGLTFDRREPASRADAGTDAG
jgi:NADP-dependent 3-hydroxy acid dehydrogenase YdfG